MNILNVLEQQNIIVKQVATTKGGEYAGPCPHCGGSDRFRVWPAERGGEGSYWCRGCEKSGDLVQFFKDFCGYSYSEAFKAAGRSTSSTFSKHTKTAPIPQPVSNPTYATSPTVKLKEYQAPPAIWQEKANKLVTVAHENLLQSPKIINYLNSRGINIQAIKQFQLGFLPGEKENCCMYRPRKSWGLPKIINKKTGRDKMLWIPRGIIIPCFKNNKIYRIRIRRPKADLKTKNDIKYYIFPGSGMDAMFIPSPEKIFSKFFTIVEAELDAMLIASHAGFITSVVSLGAAQIKPGKELCNILKNATQIFLALDQDHAGQQANSWWQENFTNATILKIPIGKDPGEAYQQNLNIYDWIKQALPITFTLPAPNYAPYKIPKNLSPMQELQILLKKYKVTIVAQETTSKINYHINLQNPVIKQRIHDLFYNNDELHWYFRLSHPAKIITGDNCFFHLHN